MKLNVEDIKVGMYVTMSNNKKTGDRSWADELLKVIAINAGHVQVEFTKSRSYGKDMIVNLAEHDFFDASGFSVTVSN